MFNHTTLAEICGNVDTCVLFFQRKTNSMHSSTNFQAYPIIVGLYCLCDKVYHKQEVHFLLYLLGQIVT